MEANLVKLLEGQSLDEVTSDLCDFTLEEQNAFTEAQGVQPSASSDYVPILGSSVTYVVACVILNEANEVLMIQEAKKSCSGEILPL
jgi:8-oxo-dGDP phosphatase